MSNATKLNGYQLWLASQYRQRSFNQLLKPSAITHAQYMVLSYMVWSDKKEKLAKLSQNQLAQELSLDAMMISNVLKALETKWFVTRTPVADKIETGAKKEESIEKEEKKEKKEKKEKEVKEIKAPISWNVLVVTSEGKELIKTLSTVVEKFEKEMFGKVNKKFVKGLESIMSQRSE